MSARSQRHSDPIGEVLHRAMATRRAVQAHEDAFEELIRQRGDGVGPDGHRRLTSWASALQDFVFMEGALLITALDELEIDESRKPEIDAELRSRVLLMRNILLHSPEVRRDLDEGTDRGRSASVFEQRHESVSFGSRVSPTAGATMGGVRFSQLVELAAAAETLAWELVRESERAAGG